MKIQTKKTRRNFLFIASLVFLFLSFLNTLFWEWLLLIAVTLGILSIFLALKIYEKEQDEKEEEKKEKKK